MGRWNWISHWFLLKGSYPTRMVGIASKCCVGLRVARHHPCVGTESVDGFSPGYVLLSFQILTPSSHQEQLTTLNWTKATPTPCMKTKENPPYKGDWLEIDPARRGGMNQNTPNPGLTPKGPILAILPIEWGRRSSPKNPKPRVVLDTQVWLQVRDGDEGSHLLAVALWLTPKESAWRRLWRGQRKITDSEHNQAGETRWYKTQSPPIPTCVRWNFACGSGRPPGYGVGLWLI